MLLSFLIYLKGCYNPLFTFRTQVENIMVDRSGHIKIVDFGLAMKITEAAEHMPAIGSLIYMAPEALRDQVGGRHTDWWAVGILAFELLTGCTPWSSLDDRKVIRHEILNSVVLPPRSLSTKAAQLVRALLHHDVDARLGSPSDQDLLSAPFFEGIDWAATASQSTAPAFAAVREGSTVDPKALDNYLARSPESYVQAPFDLGLETVGVHPPLISPSCTASKVVLTPLISSKKPSAAGNAAASRERSTPSASKTSSISKRAQRPGVRLQEK